MNDIIEIRELADLRAGDRILSLDGRPYTPPRIVAAELARIEEGSPVIGVRLHPPRPTSVIEWVLYPAEFNGRTLQIERPNQPTVDANAPTQSPPTPTT